MCSFIKNTQWEGGHKIQCNIPPPKKKEKKKEKSPNKVCQKYLPKYVVLDIPSKSCITDPSNLTRIFIYMNMRYIKYQPNFM